ncbi:distal tail protein Dit [Priestia flexa]|uniref:distal tail protein Dit n=1 Tax=Priestia flexa TaxID=86664 RepID=UPI001F4CC9EA|nr:distal tail protein Dit [Priestia flexa]
MLGMLFNNERRSYLQITQGRKRPAWAPVKRNLLYVPNRPGAYLRNTDVEPRSLTVPVYIEAKNISDLQKIKEDMAAWLVTNEACPLLFDDEPDRIYYAIIDQSIDLEEIVDNGQGQLTFICPDPYKYTTFSKYQHSIVSEGASLLTIANKGTEITSPIFEVQVDDNYTHIDISNGDQVNRIGKVVNVEDYAVQREEIVLNDKLTTTTGWAKTEGSVNIDGRATGDMKSDGYRFIAENFGTMTEGWHGPFYKKSIGQTLTDFRLEAILELLNTGEDKFGKVEVYLLDANNLPVCAVTIKDVDSAGKRIYANIRLGGGDVGFKDIISTHGEKESTFWNFFGMLRIEKVGERWTGYVAKIDKETGQHTARAFELFNDRDKQFLRKPTQVGIYLAQYGSRKVASLRAEDVRVYKMNPLTENQIPYIVQAGDVVTLDHQKENILINGEERTDLKAFGAEFFHLERGDNVIVGYPPLPIKAIWRERFK